MKKRIQNSFNTVFFALVHVYIYNFIYLLIFQLSKVDFALQRAAHMSAKNRPIICLYTILCVFTLHFDLVM